MSSLEFMYAKPPVGERSERPLTHHEIMRLVAPFTESGRRADLAASERDRRRLVFAPREHSLMDGAHTVTERLRLHAPEQGDFELKRSLEIPGAGCAVLTASGRSLAQLLAWIDEVPIERQWRTVAGVLVARSYRVRSLPLAGTTGPALQLQRAESVLAEGRVRLVVEQTLAGAPLAVQLLGRDGIELQVPPDLLSVAHRAWRPLRPTRSNGWKSSLQVPAKEPDRTAAAEARLDVGIAHLVRTLAESPAQFHAVHSPARWRAALQRAAPLLTGLTVLLLTPALMLLPARDNPAFLVIVFQLPTVMLIAFFCLREVPVLEIPPPPRPLTFPAWIRGNEQRASGREETGDRSAG